MVIRGGWLLVFIMSGLLVHDLSRSSPPLEVEPAFVLPSRPTHQVLVTGTEGQADGIHQINDAEDLIAAINLTKLEISTKVQQAVVADGRPESGKTYKFKVVRGVIEDVEVTWMPAALRMTLGIPLCVEQMEESDWDDLPGVGSSLARRFSLWRHENDGNETFRDLLKVPGIGKKRMESWSPFFGRCK